MCANNWLLIVTHFKKSDKVCNTKLKLPYFASFNFSTHSIVSNEHCNVNFFADIYSGLDMVKAILVVLLQPENTEFGYCTQLDHYAYTWIKIGLLLYRFWPYFHLRTMQVVNMLMDAIIHGTSLLKFLWWSFLKKTLINAMEKMKFEFCFLLAQYNAKRKDGFLLKNNRNIYRIFKIDYYLSVYQSDHIERG